MDQTTEARYKEQQVQKRLGEVEKGLNKALSHQRSADEEKQAESIQKVLDKEKNANETYAKLIIAAGYAGFLTFWGKSAQVIPQPHHSVIGTLFLLSLVLYIGWEVYSSVSRGIALQRMAQELAADPTPAGRAKFQTSATKYNRRMHALWITVLIPTVLLGFGCGLWVVGWYVHSLWLAM